MNKLTFIFILFCFFFIAASCSRIPRDSEKARLKAITIAQKVFKKDARKVIKITNYLPYSESGCVSYGNNGRYMVILRGNGLNQKGVKTSFRVSLDVDLTGLKHTIRSIIIDLNTSEDLAG